MGKKNWGITAPENTVMHTPAGTACNARCEYCFYHDKYQIEQADPQVYADILTGMKALEPYRILITGGECTLAGLDFFRQIACIWKASPSRSEVRHCILTNGKVVDEEWVKMFADLEAEVCLSIDLPLDLTDRYRGISSNHLLNIIKMFRKYGIKYKVTSVVTAPALARMDEIVEQAKLFSDAKRLSLAACFDGSANSDLIVNFNQFLAFLEQISEKLGERLKEIDFQGSGYLCPVRYECEGFVFVDAKGRVHLCAGYDSPAKEAFFCHSPLEFDVEEFRNRKKNIFLGKYDCKFNTQSAREFWQKFHGGEKK